MDRFNMRASQVGTIVARESTPRPSELDADRVAGLEYAAGVARFGKGS